MNRRVVVGLGTAVVAFAAGCGGGSSAENAIAPRAHTGVVSSTATATTTCRTGDLGLALGQSEGTAGSVYEPLRFTNEGEGACTLFGYPGVSFVAKGSGDQIGAPASRNPQHPARTVILSPGASADALVQVVDHGNYGADQCKATTASGLRVYPPGSKSAAYVPFPDGVTACSTDVTQLTVEAVATSMP